MLTPVVLTHREPKKPSVFRTKTSDAHPNITPQKHRHSTTPVARVKQYLTLMVARTHTHTHKQVENSINCAQKAAVFINNISKERKQYQFTKFREKDSQNSQQLFLLYFSH